MLNVRNFIKLEIEHLKKRLAEDPITNTPEIVADRFISTMLKIHEIGKDFWPALNQVQCEIAHISGTKYAVRDSLIKQCRINGGNEKELLRELYFNLPTEEESLEKQRKIDLIHRPKSEHLGTIIEVKAEKQSLSNTLTGINRSHSEHYTPASGYFGGNGTYRIGYPEVELYLFLVVKLVGHPHVRINVRSEALQVNGWQKMTESRIAALNEKLRSSRVTIVYVGKQFEEEFKIVDVSILKV